MTKDEEWEIEDWPENIEDWPEDYVCECGVIEPYCGLCGYHGHECELDLEQEN